MAQTANGLTHGPWAYNNRKCKCQTCRDGNTAYVKAQRTRPIDPDRHGGELNYRRGCRCETCSSAQAERRSASYRRSKAVSIAAAALAEVGLSAAGTSGGER